MGEGRKRTGATRTVAGAMRPTIAPGQRSSGRHDTRAGSEAAKRSAGATGSSSTSSRRKRRSALTLPPCGSIDRQRRCAGEASGARPRESGNPIDLHRMCLARGLADEGLAIPDRPVEATGAMGLPAEALDDLPAPCDRRRDRARGASTPGCRTTERLDSLSRAACASGISMGCRRYRVARRTAFASIS